MSCNYAEGLSPYEHKGVLGVPEKFDSIDKFKRKCEILAQMIDHSKHVVVHTGAGISTSAGIPDFRGPNGVWTLEREGKKPSTNISFVEAKPTKTHMILKKLVECGKVHYIVSQNIDGLHLKSGLKRKYLAELHGNMFIDECNVCKRQFVRNRPVETVGKKCSGVPCASGHEGRRPCRGRLYDGVLDWEHSLPENDLLMSEWHSSIADLSICLGTTLQIVPSGNLPLETAKYGGKLVICNLQPTKHDNKADLIINYYVDDILEKVMDILGIDIPEYNEANNPTILADNSIVDWTINRKDVLALEKLFKAKCKGVKKKRSLIKTVRNKRNSKDSCDIDDKSKVIKLDVNESDTNGKASVKSRKTTDTNLKTTVTNRETTLTNTGIEGASNETTVIKLETIVTYGATEETAVTNDQIVVTDADLISNLLTVKNHDETERSETVTKLNHESLDRNNEVVINDQKAVTNGSVVTITEN